MRLKNLNASVDWKALKTALLEILATHPLLLPPTTSTEGEPAATNTQLEQAVVFVDVVKDDATTIDFATATYAEYVAQRVRQFQRHQQEQRSKKLVPKKTADTNAKEATQQEDTDKMQDEEVDFDEVADDAVEVIPALLHDVVIEEVVLSAEAVAEVHAENAKRAEARRLRLEAKAAAANASKEAAQPSQQAAEDAKENATKMSGTLSVR